MSDGEAHVLDAKLSLKTHACFSLRCRIGGPRWTEDGSLVRRSQKLAIVVDLPLVFLVQYLLCQDQEAKDQR